MNPKEAAAALMGTDGAARMTETASALAHASGLAGRQRFDLGELSEKIKLAASLRPDMDVAGALATRIVKARESVAKHESLKTATPEAIARAKQTIAELDDELTDMMRGEAKWYAMSMAFSIGEDFQTRLRRAATDGLLTFDIPLVAQFDLVLDGRPAEPPF